MKKKYLISLISVGALLVISSLYTAVKVSMGSSEVLMGATTKIKLTDPNSVTPYATSTPTANLIPIYSASGTIPAVGIGSGFATSSAVYSTTTSATGNWDNTFDCGFAPSLIQIDFRLSGYDSSLGGNKNKLTIGTAYYAGTTLKRVFYLQNNIALDAFSISNLGVGGSTAPTSGTSGANNYESVLSITSVSANNVTVRVAVTDNSSFEAGTQSFGIICYK